MSIISPSIPDTCIFISIHYVSQQRRGPISALRSCSPAGPPASPATRSPAWQCAGHKIPPKQRATDRQTADGRFTSGPPLSSPCSRLLPCRDFPSAHLSHRYAGLPRRKTFPREKSSQGEVIYRFFIVNKKLNEYILGDKTPIMTFVCFFWSDLMFPPKTSRPLVPLPMP